MRDRLIEILEDDYDFSDFTGQVDYEALADHLLKNGVIVPPCKVGDTVYIVPSKFSYRQNCVMGANNLNRINEDRIDLIKIYEFGYSVGTFGGYILRDKNYRETWFIAKEEAEAKLAELQGE